MTEAICAHCGQPFRARRTTARFCSGAHRIASLRARRRVLSVTGHPDKGEADVTLQEPISQAMARASRGNVPVPGDGMVAGVIPTPGIRLRTHGGPFQDMPDLPAFLDRRPAKLSEAA